jgi:hypothetical protein
LPRDVVKQWIVRTLGNGRTPRRWSPETEKDKPEITAWSIAEVGKVVLAVMPFLANMTVVALGDVDRLVARARERGYYSLSWQILAVAWLVYFADVFMCFNIPTAIPLLRSEYHWSATTVGWVDSAYLWAYALTQVPWGTSTSAGSARNGP